ncbi:hypothetical protein E1A91_D09G180400v1 [Gossypium mustelinum]|uniref:Uncharacterized protein n=1 Tax=Gossypium mustelinum TaxID=34275 RepID=A0A5D2TM63_GOSMU|nr:hypothetical protein E1A91_D09G180400v1 [Gossypium mustelinum]
MSPSLPPWISNTFSCPRIFCFEKMERDEGLRTLECLRGRLLAERQASKTAKEDAELMGNKVIELEKKLKEETKVINKAEKRLKLLSKKLESLKLVPSLEESEHPAAVSCVSSTSSSGTKNPEKTASKSQNAVPVISKNMEENASDTTTSIPSFKISFSRESSFSSLENSSFKSSSVHEDPKVDDTRTRNQGGPSDKGSEQKYR